MPGPQRRVDQDRIIAEAFAVLGDAGFGGLSVRSVAARVGMSAAAFYTYFAGKQQLLRAMVEQLFADLDPRDTLGMGTVQEGLRALAMRTRARLTATSGAVALVMSGPLDGPHALAYNEVLLEQFTRAGSTIDDGARAAYAFQVWVLGFAALQSADAPAADPATEAELERVRREALNEWDVSGFPLTSQTADVVAGYNGTAQFLWGLDRLLDGLLPPARGVST